MLVTKYYEIFTYLFAFLTAFGILPGGGADIGITPAAATERTYLRYELQEADWSYDETDFPLSWREAARRAVLEETDCLDGVFARGWRLDFDGDGRDEAILLLRSPLDKNASFRNSHFVYISADSIAQYLASGCDEERYGVQKMDAWLLSYSGFVHIVVKYGNYTMASRTLHTIYSVQNGTLRTELMFMWLRFVDGVALESTGPQGIGPSYWFWEPEGGRYVVTGPVPLAVSKFLDIFDPDQFSCEDWQIKALETLGIQMDALSKEDLSSVEVYGNRYYHLTFSDNRDPSSTCMDLEHTPGGDWYISYGPGPWFNSLEAGVTDAARRVYDADLRAAADCAIGS